MIIPHQTIFLLAVWAGNTKALSSLQTSSDYLSSLSGAGPRLTSYAPAPAPTGNEGQSPPPQQQQQQAPSDGAASYIPVFSHAPLSYFAIEKLTSKGPRKNADVGAPHDATRPLPAAATSDDTTASPLTSGSWWCAAGGWPSPAQRATTEVFFVYTGHGAVTDLDGVQHNFGPGDTVILPKGWSGRWDISQDIHKVWFVHDHANIEDNAESVIRARVTHYMNLAGSPLHEQEDGDDGSTVHHARHGSDGSTSRIMYDIGPSAVSCWTCTPGSFPIKDRKIYEGYHLLEGVVFLTNVDGSAKRCVAGDTIVFPKGWTGYCDVIQTVKALRVFVQ